MTRSHITVLISALWLSLSTAICLRASIRHHADLVHSVLLAPMSFYEDTPTGRLLNRFGGDVTAMDLRLPTEFRNLMKLMVAALGCVVVVTMVTPWSLFAWLALGFVYSLVQVKLQVTRKKNQSNK